ncbi:hypothetical protein E4T38_03119 [Aureobasidium subglaciale]|nr:hypothetical protein E4T38_03119 [Aureobasidium subglaciale]KAI5226892.1 hypothetical protein E4T40_02893 [Aureobasidium subglaciale]KAI5230208.1 hypothetical protein E4T41_03116 [Aureobasidium subglaciale]KAI5264610.1 hypothetical protein E4T46_02894 [Aureobasidium subglaciale]
MNALSKINPTSSHRSDFGTGGGDLSARTVINSVPTQWWREAVTCQSGREKLVAWIEFDNVVKVTTCEDFDEYVDVQYSQSSALRAMDPNRQLDVYKVLGPLDRPKAERFWKPKGADIVSERHPYTRPMAILGFNTATKAQKT